MITQTSVLTHMGVLVSAAAVFLTGCATATQEHKGAGTGAVIGAVAGQILGRDSKSTAIGAGLGALGGYIWSKNMEDKKRAMEQATAGTGTVVTQTADNQLKLSILGVSLRALTRVAGKSARQGIGHIAGRLIDD